jgi:L-lactate dehydrogenase
MGGLGAKVTIVGVGAVGSGIAFALAWGGLVTELVLIDTDRRRAEGEAWDLDDAAAFIKPVQIHAADYPDSAGSRVVIFSAGQPRAVGQSRLELARTNLEVLRESFPRVLRYCPEAVHLIVTSPVDIITFAANRLADIGDERVVGLGTVLDTSRFKRMLARHMRVDPRNVHAYVVGEHGDPVPLWSRVSVAGFHLDDYCREQGLPLPDRAELLKPMLSRADEIIGRKGLTQFAASIAVARIVEAVLRDERSVLTVSGMVEGVYGLEGPNCFSLPAVVDAVGRHRPLPLALSEEEMTKLRETAAHLRQVHRELGIA